MPQSSQPRTSGSGPKLTKSPKEKAFEISIERLLIWAVSAAFFFLATAALNAAPGVDLGTVVAAIFNVSPVRGFLPMRAARLPF